MLKRLTAALTVAAAMAIGGNGAAMASHGADDPVGHDQGGHHHNGKHHGKHHHHHGANHHGHGNDDGPNHT